MFFIIRVEAEKGQELLDKLQTGANKPGIIILDLKIPDMDGVECTQKIKPLYPDIKILALTMYYTFWI